LWLDGLVLVPPCDTFITPLESWVALSCLPCVQIERHLAHTFTASPRTRWTVIFKHSTSKFRYFQRPAHESVAGTEVKSLLLGWNEARSLLEIAEQQSSHASALVCDGSQQDGIPELPTRPHQVSYELLCYLSPSSVSQVAVCSLCYIHYCTRTRRWPPSSVLAS